MSTVDRICRWLAPLRRAARLSVCGLAATALIIPLTTEPVAAQQREASVGNPAIYVREEAVPLIRRVPVQRTPSANTPIQKPRSRVVAAVASESAPELSRRVQPASAQFPAPVPAVQEYEPQNREINAPSVAAQQKPALVQSMDAASYYQQQNATWAAHFRQRMECVVCNEAATQQPAQIEWWYENSAQEASGHSNHGGRVGRFIADHTLPTYDQPEHAVYDSRPRVTSFGPVRTASASQEGPQDAGTVESASSRLNRDITQIQPTLSYALKGIDPSQLPSDFFEKMDNGDYVAATSSPTVLQWAPTNLYHNPLYFEDPALERYGHTYHPLVQPFASTGRFATQLVGLPYQMTLHPVHAKEYTLGWYRPGDYAPKKHYQIPFNEEATLMQVATVVGLILIFP